MDVNEKCPVCGCFGEALIQRSEDRSKQKLITHLSHAIVVAYCTTLFVESMLAGLFTKTVASGARLPVVVHTRGVKQPCSTSLSR